MARKTNHLRTFFNKPCNVLIDCRILRLIYWELGWEFVVKC